MKWLYLMMALAAGALPALAQSVDAVAVAEKAFKAALAKIATR